MSLQTDDSLRADHRVMDGAGRQIEPVACCERELLSEFGETECYRTTHNIDNLVVTVRVC
mgnify:CR=1 FL=1